MSDIKIKDSIEDSQPNESKNSDSIKVNTKKVKNVK